MAKYKFAVDAPEQLKELGPHVLIGGIGNLAVVWSADRRKNGGASKWDGKIFVGFQSSRKVEVGVPWAHAYVGRVCANGKVKEEAVLHYNKALRWCKTNLKPWEGDGDV